MKSQLWQKAIETAADPARARHFLDLLRDAGAAGALKKADAEQARILAALFSGSQALSQLLAAHPDWLAPLLDIENLKFDRLKPSLQREVLQFLKPALAAKDYPAALRKLREFKQRQMLRIGARDLAGLGGMMEIVGEISALADVCLDAVFQIIRQQNTERFGTPHHQDADGLWRPTSFAVLGMGKLGGQELNYSSDVDLLFVYSAEGGVFKLPPKKNDPLPKGMSNHQFFLRLAEAFLAEVGRLTGDGSLFRIDMRLRPEGNAGPLARSLDSYENYYAQWGQTWERMMLIKTRPVAGDPALAYEFLEMIQPFRYPRSLNERVFREVTAMKDRIENEILKSGEIERNVKLGRGGIREIEFIAQTHQLLHGGKIPFLQHHQTLAVLDKLVQYKLLAPHEAAELRDAYIFLRNVEHRLQMEDNQQTHTLPTERKARERLARLMGFPAAQPFESAQKKHCGNVRRIYDRLLKGEDAESQHKAPPGFENDAAWKKMLAEHAFRDPDKALRLVKEFVEGPGYVHVSPRTSELARDLLPRLLALCPSPSRAAGLPPPGTAVENPPLVQPAELAASLKAQVLSDPDRVLARLESFITAYGARAMLYELWSANPVLFELMILLFDRSEFLAEIAIRTPDLVDELEESGRLRRTKTAEETLRDLRHGLEDEDQKLWIRRYHQAELMRLGLRDILGLVDFEQNLAELSALADACLQYALDVVMRRNKLKAPPFCVIGMGKLGGREIDYGSDLDVVFVADAKTRNLAALQKYAAEFKDLLSARTEQGSVFEIDARLRPDGEKGLLVNTLPACEEYYRNRAQLWEIQALTRTRPVAGDMETGAAFQKTAATLADFSKPSLPLASFTPEWKKEIARMRLRIEKERTPAGKDDLAIKTGVGGLIDAEFLAQTFCLERGWQEANTLAVLERAKAEAVLPVPDMEKLLVHYRRLRRVEGILRRWSYEGEILLPDDPAPMYRVAVRCGYRDAGQFLQALGTCRRAIREVYRAVLA